MAKVASVLETDNILNIAQRRCESQGINIHWSHSHRVAATNGDTIILPAIQQPITAEQLDALYGLVVHECGHHARPDAFKILNAARPEENLAMCFNILEDDGMEREQASKYLGDCKALGTSNSNVVAEIAENFTKHKWPEGMPKQEYSPIAAMALGQLSRLNWDTFSQGAIKDMIDSIPSTGRELLDELVSEGWVDRLRNTQNPDDTWDAAIDLYKRLYPEKDQDELEKQRQQGHSKVPKEPESGDKQDGKGEGKPKDSSEGGKENGDKDTAEAGVEKEGVVVSWKDMVLSDHNQERATDGPAGNIGIDWEGYQDVKGVQLMPQKLVNVIDFTDKAISNQYRERETPSAYMATDNDSRGLANQVRRYIQAKDRTLTDRERRHGTLDKRSIIKLALPPIDKGDWNKKVFYRMSERQEINTCVLVLVDWSGSMQGKKMKYASDAAGRLVSTFDRVLKVPVQVAAFSNRSTACDIGLIKKFNKRANAVDIARGFSKFRGFTSANNDADALMWAYNQIKARPEERKILIVLSDGCPAGSWGYSSGSLNLSKVTSDIQKEGKVELHGIGICSNAVREYYRSYKVLGDASEINGTIIATLKDKIK